METTVGSKHVTKGSGGDREVVTRRIAGETLIIPVAGQVGDLDAIYTLNEVGSRIWELIEGATPVSRIVDAISAEYDVSPDQAARDIFGFLDSLETRDLIRSSVGDER